jgi:two-component system, OmpR family, sensor histidine kinase VicK
LYGVENITNAILQFISKAKNRVSTCTDSTGPSVTMEGEQYKKGLLELKNRDVKVRCVTEITRENLHYCKELMKLVGELRHLDEFKGNFAVSETEYLTSMVLPEAKPVPQIIYSNVKTIVEQQKYLFDTFWEKAIPAEQKIREIEEGIEPDIL